MLPLKTNGTFKTIVSQLAVKSIVKPFDFLFIYVDLFFRKCLIKEHYL